MSLDGSKGNDIPAGENFSHLFDDQEGQIDPDGFKYWIDNSLIFVHHQAMAWFDLYVYGQAQYAFLDAARLGGGTVEIAGYVKDRAGNTSVVDTLQAFFPATPSSVFTINSSATPGTKAHVVPVGLTNFTPLRGVEFDLNFPTDIMTVDSVKSTGRVPFSPFYESTIDSSSGQGILSVVLVDLAGDLIPVTSDTIVHIYTSIKANAPSTSVFLHMENAEAVGEDGNPIVVGVASGELKIQ
jgi:hypothetical protein